MKQLPLVFGNTTYLIDVPSLAGAKKYGPTTWLSHETNPDMIFDYNFYSEATIDWRRDTIAMTLKKFHDFSILIYWRTWYDMILYVILYVYRFQLNVSITLSSLIKAGHFRWLCKVQTLEGFMCC